MHHFVNDNSITFNSKFLKDFKCLATYCKIMKPQWMLLSCEQDKC